jgi:predicted RNA-binding protein with PUA-like domain
MKYWLVKSEGDCYSIDNLKKDKTISWTGVRNFQARNFMRDGMQKQDLVFFYHSNDNPSGIYGLAKVVSLPHVDETAFDKKDEHYDPKSKRETPTWMCVDISFLKKFKNPISLADIKKDKNLKNMRLAQKGDRLSVHDVSKQDFEYILGLVK